METFESLCIRFMIWLFICGSCLPFQHSTLLLLFSYLAETQSFSIDWIIFSAHYCTYNLFHLPYLLKISLRSVPGFWFYIFSFSFPPLLLVMFSLLSAPCFLITRFLLPSSFFLSCRLPFSSILLCPTSPLPYVFPTRKRARSHNSRSSASLRPCTCALIRLSTNICYSSTVLSQDIWLSYSCEPFSCWSQRGNHFHLGLALSLWLYWLHPLRPCTSTVFRILCSTFLIWFVSSSILLEFNFSKLAYTLSLVSRCYATCTDT